MTFSSFLSFSPHFRLLTAAGCTLLFLVPLRAGTISGGPLKIGGNNNGSNVGAAGIGSGNLTGSFRGFAFGNANHVWGTNAAALGSLNEAKATSCMAVGYSNEVKTGADMSLVAGDNNTVEATGVASMTLGKGLINEWQACLVAGQYNDHTVFDAGNHFSGMVPLLIVGDGGDGNNRSNALIVFNDGSASFSGGLSIGSLEVINDQGDWVGDTSGLQGEPGPTGPAGNDGADGPEGPQGPIGQTGATGAQGIQGPAGNDGTSPFVLVGTAAEFNGPVRIPASGDLGMGDFTNGSAPQ